MVPIKDLIKELRAVDTDHLHLRESLHGWKPSRSQMILFTSIRFRAVTRSTSWRPTAKDCRCSSSLSYSIISLNSSIQKWKPSNVAVSWRWKIVKTVLRRATQRSQTTEDESYVGAVPNLEGRCSMKRTLLSLDPSLRRQIDFSKDTLVYEPI